MTARATDAPAYLDWSRHRCNTIAKPCRLCGSNAYMTDERGRPCHKICGEVEFERKVERYAGGAK